MQKGKLIVIDGTDGSGKATQTKLLVERLKKEKIKVATIDFPQYENNFFGEFIGHCLSEQYFNFISVHPKIASVLYAADRFESSKKINEWISKGYIVILDRYVSANQIHQGGKIQNNKKREEFLHWLDKMEYGVFKIPRPTVTLFLSIPFSVSEKLIKERDQKAVRNYLGKKKDVHEADVNFKKNSYKSALWLSKNIKNFIKVDCTKNSEILSREEIHDMIYTNIKKFLK